jgi:hypothetical protein
MEKDTEQEKHRKLLRQIRQFFVLETPCVEFVFRDAEGELEVGPGLADVPDAARRLPDQWRSISYPNFDAILWSLPSRVLALSGFAPWNAYGTELAHNGILIRKPDESADHRAYEWADQTMSEVLQPPSVAVFDSRQELKLALNRYELAEAALPFEDELLQSIGLDLVAHALVCGESPHPLATAWGLQPLFSRECWLPMIPAPVRTHINGPVCVLLVEGASEQRITPRFLRGRTKGGHWRELPFRTALSPLDIYDSEDLEELEWKTEDSVHRDHAEKEVRRSIDQLGFTFHLWPSSGVLVRAHAPTPITSLYGETDDEPPDALLASIGKELSETPNFYADYFALVLLQQGIYVDAADEGLAEPWVEPLARPWQGIVKGMLERSPKARGRRRDEITTQNKRLRALVNKWERFSKIPEWPDRG